MGWFGQVVAWLIIVPLFAAITVCVLLPRVAGATPYTILTGSMRPNMPPGTLVVIKPVPVDQVSVGTVVTYQLDSGKPTVVTHRVVAITTTVKGKKSFTTQGDANDATDAKQVRPIQIKGELWYHIKYLGYVNTFITGKERHVTTIAIVSGLLLYAAFMFTSSLRDKFGKRRRLSSADAS